jgi:hypothetical protein
VSEASHGRETKLDSRVRATCFRGSLHDFFYAAEKATAQDKEKENPPTIMVGFNTGFGNTNRKLTREWLPSLLEASFAQEPLPAPSVLRAAEQLVPQRGSSSEVLLAWVRAKASSQKVPFGTQTVGHRPKADRQASKCLEEAVRMLDVAFTSP